jgi:hypothetical protein
MVFQLNINGDSKLYLVGFRIDSDNDTGIDFYTLYFDDERPIDCDGFPIFFFNPTDMKKVLDMSNCGCNHLSLPQQEDIRFIDIAYTIYEIGVCNKTENANLLDTLNMLWDFTAFFDNRTHQEFRKIIRHAANNFTTSYDIERYFNESKMTRDNLIQAIEWVIGATLIRAKYIRPEI